MSQPSTRFDSTIQLNDYVLVVDDVAEVRRSVRSMLERDGLEVISADSALAGFTAILELGPPLLLICDQRMDEGGPGLRLLDYCAEHHPQTRRILHTGYFDGTVAMAAARHVVVEKGQMPDVLRAAVRRALEY